MEKISGTYDYARLDASGEADRAVFRMESRAEEPASAALFDALVRPLLLTPSEPRRVLEVGAGTGALARRILASTTKTEVVVSDKSETMLAAARAYGAKAPGFERTAFVPWDVCKPGPSEVTGPFDLVISSVMVPYLDDDAIAKLIAFLASTLEKGGTLAFVEQDLQTVSLHHACYAEVRGLFARTGAHEAPYLPLRLRAFLRDAGLTLLPRKSFLWTADSFVPYLRDLVSRAIDDAVASGRIEESRCAPMLHDLETASAQGHFYYGLVYHLVAARR